MALIAITVTPLAALALVITRIIRVGRHPVRYGIVRIGTVEPEKPRGIFRVIEWLDNAGMK